MTWGTFWMYLWVLIAPLLIKTKSVRPLAEIPPNTIIEPLLNDNLGMKLDFSKICDDHLELVIKIGTHLPHISMNIYKNECKCTCQRIKWSSRGLVHFWRPVRASDYESLKTCVAKRWERPSCIKAAARAELSSLIAITSTWYLRKCRKMAK